jgi:hypothetical protein
VGGKIIHDRVVANNSTLLNYSRKPTLKKPKFTELAKRAVMDEIMFYACPAKEQVTRRLYYVKDPNAEGEQINEGVNLADENRWSLAATKWTNVLLKDKKNLIAHHNLGVHYERSGEIFQAMNHFKQARSGKSGTLMDNVIEEIRTKYQSRVDGSAIYPQVSFVTGGNWAYVRSDAMAMTEGQTHSLYRFEPVVNPETSRTMGLLIREVGLLKVAATAPQYYPGRIKEFLIDYPVKPGDFVITE